MRNKLLKTGLLTLLMLTSLGCLRTDVVIAHPDAPLFVTGSVLFWARVAVYSKKENAMLDAGYKPWSDFVGKTAYNMDWESYIAGQIEPKPD